MNVIHLEFNGQVKGLVSGDVLADVVFGEDEPSELIHGVVERLLALPFPFLDTAVLQGAVDLFFDFLLERIPGLLRNGHSSMAKMEAASLRRIEQVDVFLEAGGGELIFRYLRLLLVVRREVLHRALVLLVQVDFRSGKIGL